MTRSHVTTVTESCDVTLQDASDDGGGGGTHHGRPAVAEHGGQCERGRHLPTDRTAPRGRLASTSLPREHWESLE